MCLAQAPEAACRPVSVHAGLRTCLGCPPHGTLRSPAGGQGLAVAGHCNCLECLAGQPEKTRILDALRHLHSETR